MPPQRGSLPVIESIQVVNLEWCVLDPRVGLDRHRPRFLLLLLFVTVKFAKFRAFIFMVC